MANIAVDLDGVLAQYHGWTAIDDIGVPYQGAQTFLRELKQRGHRVIIHSCRGTSRYHKMSEKELEANIKNWLDRHGFVYDEIWTAPGKPIASAYVDDRAVHCDPTKFTLPDTSYGFAIAAIELLLKNKVSNEPDKTT